MEWLKRIKHRLRLVRRRIREGTFSNWASVSFGQEGEDLMLSRQLDGTDSGFYVDVGALHPLRFSNTWAFYTRGWKGIVVEPNPDVSGLFRARRPRDIFVGEGVAGSVGQLTYHSFNEAALNTFDPNLAEEREGAGHTIVRRIPIAVRPLASILDEHLPLGHEITILSVDVEGLDEEVLLSNNWTKYRPLWVVVEILDCDLLDIARHPITTLLVEVGYTPVAKTGHSVAFRRN